MAGVLDGCDWREWVRRRIGSTAITLSKLPQSSTPPLAVLKAQRLRPGARRYPDVHISLSLTDYPVDLHPIRSMSRCACSSLMSRKIGAVERVICASPKYLNQFGIPKCRDDLTQRRCIVFTLELDEC